MRQIIPESGKIGYYHYTVRVMAWASMVYQYLASYMARGSRGYQYLLLLEMAIVCFALEILRSVLAYQEIIWKFALNTAHDTLLHNSNLCDARKHLAHAPSARSHKI